jgi:hypothetical protein
MSDRKKIPELIDLYNSGMLNGEELQAFLHLLKTNPRLREEVKLDNELDRILANDDILQLRRTILKVQKKNNKNEGPDINYYLLAASVVILIGIEVLLFLNKSNRFHTDDTTVTVKERTGPGPAKGNNQADKRFVLVDSMKRTDKTPEQPAEPEAVSSYRKNPAFENMIGATRQLSSFRMDAPMPGTAFSKKTVILFKWFFDDHSVIKLTILNNKGASVHESEALKGKRYSLPAGTLTKGLYYFKVIQDDEIVYFGKFLIK